ncbi:MAG: acyl-CoA dehydrogenase family protein [Gammaproteobacteria bacterium]|nr:acyl-CoA dehydrogenase family protein [Gammaproteobacteria bacterium]
MNLQLTSEQQMLRESAARWVAERGRPAQGAVTVGPVGARWREMADMGWLAMTLPERDGGLGQGVAEACVLAEALGAGPVVEPYLPAVVLAGGLLAAGGSDAQRQRWLAALASGETLVVPATSERAAGHDIGLTATRAARQGTGWVLDGDKTAVAAGDIAQAWIVAARADESTIAFFLIERGTAGVTPRDFPSIDGAGACALSLRGVRLDDSARLPGATRAAFGQVNDQALLVACAESVGAMDTLVKATVEYTKQRIQFGRPLAANQVLRHRMADMSIATEEARSITLGAILALQDAEGSGNALARTRAAAAARAKVGMAARRVAEEAVQLHGGMGVTEELTIGVYLRRQMALDAMLGPAEWHLRRHAQLRGARDGGSEDRNVSLAGT